MRAVILRNFTFSIMYETQIADQGFHHDDKLDNIS